MRYFFLFLFLMGGVRTASAQVYYTLSGHIRFFSDAPLEDIEAVNDFVSSFIDLKRGKVVAKVPIRKFDFPNDLMEEHFNERFLHSDRYPNAEFRGVVKGLSKIDLAADTPQKVMVEGKLTLHGVTKPYRFAGTIRRIKAGGYRAKGRFRIRLSDHNIRIPAIVSKKIAEEVDVFVDFTYKPYQRKHQ